MTEYDVFKAVAAMHGKKFLVFSQVKNGSTHKADQGLRKMDMLCIARSWSPVECRGVEIKCSHQDFLQDSKVGETYGWCNRFYWACPAGLIAKDEVTARAGLIYVNPRTGRARTVKAAPFGAGDPDWRTLLYLLFWQVDEREGGRDAWGRRYHMEQVKHEMDVRKRLGHSYGKVVSKRLEQVERDCNEKMVEAASMTEALSEVVAVQHQLGLSDAELAAVVKRVAQAGSCKLNARDVRGAIAVAERAAGQLKSLLSIIEVMKGEGDDGH